MLEEFKKWFDNEKKQSLLREGVIINIEGPSTGTDKPGTQYDFETDSHMGRITVWSTGEFQLEIIEIENETNIYEEYLELLPGDNLSARFREYFEKLIR